jgi:hypothetical protein
MTTDTVKFTIDIPKTHSEEQLGFVRSTYLRQVIKAGRRWGKTVGAAIKALEAFLGICPACGGDRCSYCDNTGKARPKRVLYAAPTAEQVSKFWYVVNRVLAPAIDAGYFKKDETEKFIEVPNTEQRIKAKTAWNANTLRGDFADLLILEEFQLMNEDTWDEVGRPMLFDNNGTAIFIYTPPSLKSEGISKAKDPRHATKLYKKAEADTTGRWTTFHFTSYQNPTLSQEAMAEVSSDMSFDAYRREVLAEDDEIQASWMVYSKFREEVCKIKRFEIPSSWPVISGHDFGMANPAALFVAQVKLPIPEEASSSLRYGDYVIFREYLPGAGYSTIQNIEKFKELSRGYQVTQSVGGNANTEQEIRMGYGVQGWSIIAPLEPKVNSQVDRVKRLMETDKIFVFEDLYGLLGELANCMWELDENKRPLDKIKNESRFHLLACLRYLCTYIPIDRPFIQRVAQKVKVKIW